MRSRLALRLALRQKLLRDLLVRPRAAEPTVRHFTYNSTTFSSRPQLPFLSIPSRVNGSYQQWRRITTERIKHEVGLAMKFTVYVWTIVFFVAVGGFAVQQEWMEQKYPTPHEWTFRSRMLKRGVDAERGRTDVIMENWVLIVQMLQDLLEKLEDPSKDGKGLKDVTDGPSGAKDITGMSEPWRRGYVQALLLCCQASEHVEGYVLDKTRGIVFPQNVVRGPSNPFPKPVPPGSESPPREEDCVPSGFPDPDQIYIKLLATEGLTSRQRIDATLSYANWLENKGRLAPAAVMYEDALNLAIEEIYTPGAPFILDPKTAVLNPKAESKPSANLLASLTALATFKARHEDVSNALPMLISILQARRSLPAKTQPLRSNDDFPLHKPTKSSFQKILDFVKTPEYPLPPPDGTAPPVRDSKELCEEAALHLHIGEIMYTLQSSTKEDGLAWTREGVDLAEEELHKVLEQYKDDRVTKKVCRECLASGLANWRTMVARMAQQEEKAKAGGTKPSAGWFGLWSGSKLEEDGGRWAAEEKVVDERTRRAQDILEDLPQPRSAFLSGLVRA